jgi:hypothetical protein
MKRSRVLKAVLFVSGLIAAIVGVATLFAPEAFHASSGIDLGGQISLLSEVRAPGAALMASGILIVSSAFADRLAFTSVVVSTLLYLSYGLSRLLRMAVDGMPADDLVLATVLELVVGLTSLFVLARYRKRGAIAVSSGQGVAARPSFPSSLSA